mmetsp:Transcript_29055/g.85986  ORF Transcript_29055/g.85986 Transcript_29055/m.85986 type:complete len:292 (-) Transcript_29055:10-885(-)
MTAAPSALVRSALVPSTLTSIQSFRTPSRSPSPPARTDLTNTRRAVRNSTSASSIPNPPEDAMSDLTIEIDTSSVGIASACRGDTTADDLAGGASGENRLAYEESGEALAKEPVSSVTAARDESGSPVRARMTPRTAEADPVRIRRRPEAAAAGAASSFPLVVAASTESSSRFEGKEERVVARDDSSSARRPSSSEKEEEVEDSESRAEEAPHPPLLRVCAAAAALRTAEGTANARQRRAAERRSRGAAAAARERRNRIVVVRRGTEAAGGCRVESKRARRAGGLEGHLDQ